MAHYSIKELEHLSGVKAHTIRIWEQRYNLLHPKRTETNIRYYTDADLKLLLNIALLNQRGFKISRIAKMSEQELRQEVLKLTDTADGYDAQISKMLLAMIELDEEQFDKIFSTVNLQLGFENNIQHVIYPFLERIGILWQTGSINPAHEHFISNLIRQKMVVAIDGQVKKSLPEKGKFLLFLP
ncbi:MAG: MerR family transcriptional regulator, partial [Hymenobacteraceae bacterium]|nr:MerR family transcriptional regulator [Hymenobacteraceae bacterium]MDX5397514.1 MerR family transcriptional regulator [Hymenobacteraceae bacterium]MDX5443815.1 MerR family transcriptional regulator [Hymenobacteraceae bacterium]MDX5513593.1 MerR family transcriptional regulator [Hymenobacteraceae bacterium]